MVYGQDGARETLIHTIVYPASLVPRPLRDFISQPWRKIDFSPWLRDKIWEWPGDEASIQLRLCVITNPVPLRRGQPLYKGQMARPQCVLCLEVLLYNNSCTLDYSQVLSPNPRPILQFSNRTGNEATKSNATCTMIICYHHYMLYLVIVQT